LLLKCSVLPEKRPLFSCNKEVNESFSILFKISPGKAINHVKQSMCLPITPNLYFRKGILMVVAHLTNIMLLGKGHIAINNLKPIA